MKTALEGVLTLFIKPSQYYNMWNRKISDILNLHSYLACDTIFIVIPVRLGLEKELGEVQCKVDEQSNVIEGYSEQQREHTKVPPPATSQPLSPEPLVANNNNPSESGKVYQWVRALQRAERGVVSNEGGDRCVTAERSRAAAGEGIPYRCPGIHYFEIIFLQCFKILRISRNILYHILCNKPPATGELDYRA